MPQKIVIPAPRFGGGGSFNRYAALLEPVTHLGPDEALLVTSSDINVRAADLLQKVLALKAGLRSKLRAAKLVMVEDLDNGGVWLYRSAGWLPGNGSAVGPAKETEIRSRPLDK